MEPFRHFGPYVAVSIGALVPLLAPILRSCFNGSYDTAAAGAGSDILGADFLILPLDCACSGANVSADKHTPIHAGVTHARKSLRGRPHHPSFPVTQQSVNGKSGKLASGQIGNDKCACVQEWSSSRLVG